MWIAVNVLAWSDPTTLLIQKNETLKISEINKNFRYSRKVLIKDLVLYIYVGLHKLKRKKQRVRFV